MSKSELLPSAECRRKNGDLEVQIWIAGFTWEREGVLLTSQLWKAPRAVPKLDLLRVCNSPKGWIRKHPCSGIPELHTSSLLIPTALAATHNPQANFKIRVAQRHHLQCLHTGSECMGDCRLLIPADHFVPKSALSPVLQNDSRSGTTVDLCS